MAVTRDIFAKGLTEIAKGNIDFENDTIKCAILNTTHTTNITTQEYLDDVNANEVSGTGYTAGGVTITSIAVANQTGKSQITADDAAWTGLVASNARYALVYKSTGTASTSPLLFIIDFGETFSPADQDFEVQWASGVLLEAQEA